MQAIQTVTWFMRSEDGASAVDWTIITALVVGLVLAVFQTLGTSVSDHGTLIGEAMANRPVGAY